VERDLRAYLDCGILARGFARVRCPGCGFERLRPGTVHSKRGLFDRVFDSNSEAGVGALELYFHRLRRKLDSSGVLIRTVRHVRYAIEAADRVGPRTWA
jgi:exonuclease VII large subunit